MDKTFEVEVVRLSESSIDAALVSVSVDAFGRIVLTARAESALIYNTLTLLPSEAVTIGEQLIAAGKAGE
ncbi:hypothetical protein [Stenotrophomonas geniculata]|uniref:hypothetical protein n=1 Tax=Stenotrophomonas geniculata TaxID=86188 RepID=UPI002E76C683|nr:hypothetical protein [Stenotrophomonas geniculata]